MKLIVFDMDDVLARLDRRRRLALLAERTGHGPDHIDKTIFRSGFEAAAEAGAYGSGAAYLAEFNRRLGTDLSRDEWLTIRRQAMELDFEVLAIARPVAARCSIALLTNNGALIQQGLGQLLPEVAALFGVSFR